MSELSALAPAQEQVLALISAGSTISDAARISGVHRNTIHNWLRSAPSFQVAFHHARHLKAILWREQAEQLASEALDTIRSVMTAESTSPAVRLKAAQEILAIAMAPPPEPVPALPAGIDFPLETVTPSFSDLHNSAQSLPIPFRRAFPKVGRNEPCPCGSGRKFKQCCLNSPPAEAMDPATAS
jgi:transposase-like protein